MKHAQLLALSVLALGLQGAAHAFPSDAEGDYNFPARSTYADKYAGTQSMGSGNPFPSDAEASYNPPAAGSHAGRNQWAGTDIPFPSDAEAVQLLPVRAKAPANVNTNLAEASAR